MRRAKYRSIPVAPQLKEAPCCTGCGHPYALRYRDDVVRFSVSPIEMLRRWIWMRDCSKECRKAQPLPVVEPKAVKVDKMPKPRTRKAVPRG